MAENKTPKKQVTKKSRYNKIQDIFRLNKNPLIIQNEIAKNIEYFNVKDLSKFIYELHNNEEILRTKVEDLQEQVYDLQAELKDNDD